MTYGHLTLMKKRRSPSMRPIGKVRSAAMQISTGAISQTASEENRLTLDTAGKLGRERREG